MNNIKIEEMLDRTIKFRGLRKDGNGWVYGFYGILGDDTDLEKHVIMVSTLDSNIQIDRFYFTDIEVIPETVGQFTGKKCKITGDRIFTGDIVKDYQGGIYHVVYDTHYAAFMIRSSLIYSGAQRMEGNYEKAGNIFDDTFTEPEPKGIEPPSKTPSSDSFTRRNQKESLRGIK